MSAVEVTSRVHVCDIGDVPLGEGLRVEDAALPEPIAVFNDDGEYFALSDTCSHGQSSLADGEVSNRQVECTLHWARFDLETGRACALPALLPVRSYAVTVEGEHLYVTLPSEGAM